MNLFDPQSPLNYYQGFGVGDGWKALDSQAWVRLDVYFAGILLLLALFRWQLMAAGGAALFGYSVAPVLLGAFGSVFQFHHFLYLIRLGWLGPLGAEVYIYMTWSSHIGLFAAIFLLIVLFCLRTVLRSANNHEISPCEGAGK